MNPVTTTHSVSLCLRGSWSGERGQALIETALTFPLVLLLSISVFEFGRAFQHWQILTNAAREGARVAVLPGKTNDQVTDRVQAYLEAGALADAGAASVAIERNVEISIGEDTASGSMVSISYPFEFIVLQPLMGLIAAGSEAGDAITMTTSATMRNE